MQALKRFAASATRESWALGLFALATVALAVLWQWDEVLRDMHLPGAESVGINSLADVGFRLGGDPEVAGRGVIAWLEYDDSTRHLELADSHAVAARWLLVDIVFALLIAAIIVFLGRRARVRLNAHATNKRHKPYVDVYRRLLLVGSYAACLYLVCDWLENLFTWRTIGEIRDVVDPLLETGRAPPQAVKPDAFGELHLFATGKWIFLTMAAVPLLLSGLALLLWSRRRRRRAVLDALSVVRAQVLILGLFAVGILVDPTGQAADAIRRWVDEPHKGAAAVGVTLWLGVLSGAIAWHLLGRVKTRRLPFGWWGIGVLAVAGGGAGLTAILLERRDAGEGLYALTIVLAVIAVLSAASYPHQLKVAKLRDVTRDRAVIGALIAAAPVVVLGIATSRAAIPEVTLTDQPWYGTLFWTGIGLQVLGWIIFIGLRRFLIRRTRGTRGTQATPALFSAIALVAVSILASTAIAILVWFDPWKAGDGLGAIAVLAAFLVTATLIAYGLVWLAERIEPPQAFLMIGLRRTPVFTLLFAWVLIATSLDDWGKYHDVRTATTASPPEHSTRMLEAFGAWRSDAAQGKAVPFVVVAASGGGIRAAYWTASVLDCVFENARPCSALPDWKPLGVRPFVASGVSGGSLGLVSFAAHRHSRSTEINWVEKALSADTLAPTLAWSLFVDLPVAFVRRNGGTDRAEVLEKSWERSWPSGELESGIYELRGSKSVPVLLLNGTKVQDGCRFIVSQLDVSIESGDEQTSKRERRLADDCLSLRLFDRERPYVRPENRLDWAAASSEDLDDYVCLNSDVRLSTAALLSARFPFISPSGRIARCRDRETPDAPGINIVDGGYFDTSAASTALEVWHALEAEVTRVNVAQPPTGSRGPTAGRTCIVPVFLQIDNAYAEVSAMSESRPQEAGVPLKTLGGTRRAREAQARQTAALVFSRPFGPVVRVIRNSTKEPIDRFAHLYPRAHPGTTAPLGWTLSKIARDDLRRQLGSAENLLELEKIRDWFAGDLTCEQS